jgi:hypothetical protein
MVGPRICFAKVKLTRLPHSRNDENDPKPTSRHEALGMD